MILVNSRFSVLKFLVNHMDHGHRAAPLQAVFRLAHAAPEAGGRHQLKETTITGCLAQHLHLREGLTQGRSVGRRHPRGAVDGDGEVRRRLLAGLDHIPPNRRCGWNGLGEQSNFNLGDFVHFHRRQHHRWVTVRAVPAGRTVTRPGQGIGGLWQDPDSPCWV